MPLAGSARTARSAATAGIPVAVESVARSTTLPALPHLGAAAVCRDGDAQSNVGRPTNARYLGVRGRCTSQPVGESDSRLYGNPRKDCRAAIRKIWLVITSGSLGTHIVQVAHLGHGHVSA